MRKRLSWRIIMMALTMSALVLPAANAEMTPLSAPAQASGAGLIAFDQAGDCTDDGALIYDSRTPGLTMTPASTMWGIEVSGTIDGGGSGTTDLPHFGTPMYVRLCGELSADASGVGPSCLGFGGDGSGRMVAQRSWYDDTEYRITGLSWDRSNYLGTSPWLWDTFGYYHFVATGSYSIYRSINGSSPVAPTGEQGTVLLAVQVVRGGLSYSTCATSAGTKSTTVQAFIATLIPD